MDVNSILDQEQLKKQCNEAIKVLYDRDNKLELLYSTFSRCNELNCKGSAHGSLEDVCVKYMELIQGIMNINYYDTQDHTTLRNKLQKEKLVGREILEAIDTSKENENKYHGYAENYYSKANGANELWVREIYLVFAREMENIASLWNGVWQRWCAKRDFYDSVESETSTLFTISAKYWPFIQMGLDEITTSFKDGEYSLQTKSTWQFGIDQLNEKFIDDFKKQFIKDNGEYDYDAIDSFLQKKPYRISYTEYKALGIIFEEMPLTDKEKFISLAFNQVDETYTGMDYKINISPVYRKMTDVYAENLHLNLNSNGELSAADQNKILTYNLGFLYSYLDPYYIESSQFHDGLPERDLRAYASIKETENGYIVKMYRDENDFEGKEYTIYDYSYNLNSRIHDEQLLYENKKREDAWGEFRDEGRDMVVGVFVGRVASTIDKRVLDNVPILGTVYGVYSDYSSFTAAYEEAKANAEAWTCVTTMDSIEDRCRDYHVGGSMIACDGAIWITAYDYSSTTLDSSITEYNSDHPDTPIPYDSDTFIDRILTDEDFSESIRTNDEWYKVITDTAGDKKGEQVYIN